MKTFHCVNIKNLILKWQAYIPCPSKLTPKNIAWQKQTVQSELKKCYYKATVTID